MKFFFIKIIVVLFFYLNLFSCFVGFNNYQELSKPYKTIQINENINKISLSNLISKAISNEINMVIIVNYQSLLQNNNQDILNLVLDLFEKNNIKYKIIDSFDDSSYIKLYFF